MRSAAISLLVFLLFAGAVGAAPINYEQIPADVTGYFYVDFERLLSARFLKQIPDGSAIAQISNFIGPRADVAMYTIKAGESAGIVILMHAPDSKITKGMDTIQMAGPGSFWITYNKEEILYSTRGFGEVLFPRPDAMISSTTRPVPATAVALKPEQKNQNAFLGSRFTLGFGGEGFGPRADQFLSKGPCYVAFIGPDFIVAAPDLPSIAGEIDVLHGTKPSLAKSDPRGMKMDPPPGVIAMGAGLTAGFTRDTLEKQTSHSAGGAADRLVVPFTIKQPSHSADGVDDPAPIGKPGNGLGMNLFGSLEAKAKVARFDFGEDEKNLYVDGLFTMDDAESAEELKNLATGVKALICLSQIQDKPLLDPIQLHAAGKDMAMRWTWSVDQFPDLVKLVQSINQTPATRPAD